MIFAAPWVLLALAALPVLWWLLRVTPPAPRSERFPAIRLLAGLRAQEETPARTPWWLMALRLLAATLLIVGLAGPVLDAGSALPGAGPLLLVIDDGWASAADWPARIAAADSMLARAAREHRSAALLATADANDAHPPAISPVMPVADLRAQLAALRPKPWPVDRAGAAAALSRWNHQGGPVAYLAGGLSGPGDSAFATALRRAGSVVEVAPDPPQAAVLLPPRAEPDRLVARLAQLPQPMAGVRAVLAQSGDGRTLARATFTLAPGARTAEAAIKLPPELRNRLARLVLEGPASAASVTLLDERWRRRPVGLMSPDAAANVPLSGALYYLQRALSPFVELREGSIATLLKRQIAVIVLADEPLAPGPDQTALTKWVEQGGLLVRFAGPRIAGESAQATDPGVLPQAGTPGRPADGLLPVKLLAGDRQLGGALSWARPAHLAPFPPGSPFAGLAVPEDVTVNRQVLAEPSALLAGRTWARLADGTPLVTAERRGRGRVVLFHVTANADWSNLPLSGLFVEMMRRLVDLSVGLAPAPSTTPLAPAQTLDGFGTLGPPPQAAAPLAGNAFATTPVSARHPPGLYGPQDNRHALNLGAALPPLRAAAPIPGARLQPITGIAKERALGPWLLAAALALIALDMLVALGLRGLLRPATVGILFATALAATAPARAADPEAAALHTRLAYVETGDAQVDQVSRQGLVGLSEFVNQRTAATLAEPAAVAPGVDDLSVYPLLYWPITPAEQRSTAAIAALNSFMRHGGLILIDTGGAGGEGSGADYAPGTEALRRVTQGLDVPPLAPLTTDHVLSRAFYLLSEYPGRYVGDTVWVQRDQSRENDSVSPVIIGNNDWAAAWATDRAGRNLYAVIPGGDRQRLLAYRFGVNLVMYALTGNYKGDQVHVPAILERLGQ